MRLFPSGRRRAGLLALTSLSGVLALSNGCGDDDGPPDEACTPCVGEPLPGCDDACSKDTEPNASPDESDP